MHDPVRLLAIGASFAAVCLTAGCGGDEPSEGSAPSAKTMPVAEYRAQAEPLCEQASEAMADTEMPSSFPAELKDFGKGAKAMTAAIGQPFEQLAALAAPEGLREPHGRFNAALTKAVGEARRLGDLVKAGNDDTDALWLVRTNVATFAASAMTEAETLGLEGCTELEFKAGGH